MLTIQTVSLPAACANIDCSNKAGEGRFVMLVVPQSEKHPHRPVRLWMCVPCAEHLKEAL